MKKFYEWMFQKNAGHFIEQRILPVTNPTNANDLEKQADELIFNQYRINEARQETLDILKEIDKVYQENVDIYKFATKENLRVINYRDYIRLRLAEPVSKNTFVVLPEERVLQEKETDLIKKMLDEYYNNLYISHEIIKNNLANVLPRTLPYIIAIKDLKVPNNRLPKIVNTDGKEIAAANLPFFQRNFGLVDAAKANPKMANILLKYYKPYKDLPPDYFKPEPFSPFGKATPQEELNYKFERDYDILKQNFCKEARDNGGGFIRRIESHFSDLVPIKALDYLKIKHDFREPVVEREKSPYEIPLIFKDINIEEDFIEYIGAKIRPIIIDNIKYGAHLPKTDPELINRFKRMPQGIRWAFN
jgi:transcriptional regulator CtsR